MGASVTTPPLRPSISFLRLTPSWQLALHPSQVREQRVFIAMFERLDLTVSIEMDHEGKVINCSKNVYDVFGHKRKYAPPR